MLKHRLVTALLLGSLFLGALYILPAMFWALFLLLFIGIGAWEWGGLAGFAPTGRRAFLGLIVLAGLLLSQVALPATLHAPVSLLLLASSLFWLVLAPLWLRYRWTMGSAWISALTGCVLLLPPWLALVQLRAIDPGVVLATMAAVWLADSAAYFVGKRCGRHKLAPMISPGKTWEGLAGAVTTVAAVATALCAWQNWSFWLVPGSIALVLLSVMGDLFESLIKRQAGKKDSGSLLPGHGGILDRIDSLTSTLPVVALAAHLVQFFTQPV